MKRLVVILIALTGVLTSGRTALGAVQPTSVQTEAWRAYQSRAPRATLIRWDEELGCPATIRHIPTRGDLASSAVIGATRERAISAAREFFDANRSLFSFREGIDAMAFQKEHEWEGSRFVRVAQQYRGIPVDGGGYAVTFRPDGQIGFISGRARSGIDVDVRPRLTADEAGTAAVRSLAAGPSRTIEATNLTILPTAPKGRLTWAVDVYSKDGSESWRIFVDAKSGRILETQDRIWRSHASRASAGSAPAPAVPSGSVSRDARRPSTPTPGYEDGGGDDWGGGDPPGATCQPEAARIYPRTHCMSGLTDLTLPRLTSSNYTTGEYVQVQSDATRPECRAYDPDGCKRFLYTPPDPNINNGYDDSGLDDVNVYYHVDNALYSFWWEKFGFRTRNRDGAQAPRVVAAWTHARQDTVIHNSQAWYSPSTRSLYFGDGQLEEKLGIPPTYDPAKNPGIILHELSHLVMDDYGWLGGNNFMAVATGEGMADYFAATFHPNIDGTNSGDPQLGRCYYRACPLEPARTLESPAATYNYGNPGLMHMQCGTEVAGWQSSHVIGMILSGAMWTIRTELGPTIADRMAYYAIQTTSGYANFQDIRDACYDYDQFYLFGVSHCQLQNIFASRGIDLAPSLLPAPPNVQATDGLCTVKVTWGFVPGASGYRVFQAGVPLVPDATAGQNEYPVPNPPTTPTLFEVRALNCVGAGNPGSDYGHRMPPPPPPSSCTATDATVDCKVVVTWTDVSGEDGFEIFRDGESQGTKPANVLSFDDTTASQGLHTYTVRSLLCGAKSADSPGDLGSRKPTPLGPPSLNASDGIPNRVDLTWADVSGEQGYNVYRDMQLIAGGLAANTTSYPDENPPYGRHYYSVKPYSCEGEGMGAGDEGYRQPPPIAVSIAGATSSSSGASQTYTITVTGGLAPYTYQWSKYRDCPDPLATATPGGSASADRAGETPRLDQVTCWEWSNLIAVTNSVTVSDGVDFRVKCVVTDGAGASGFSQRNVDVAGVVGESQAPVTTVAATDGDANVNKVNITWGPSDGAEGFRVYRGATLIATRFQNDRSYVDPAAPIAISSYCVVAYSGGQTSVQVCDAGYPYVPLNGTISGPTSLAYNQTGTYTLNLSSGGIPPVTRQWYHATYCEDPFPGPAFAREGDVINVPPCDERHPFGSGGTSINWMGSYDVELSCLVTDAAGRTTQPSLIVDVADVIANQMAPDPGARDAAQFVVAPDRTELLAIGNPVKSSAELNFTLASPLRVRLDVFDVFGRRVETLADEELPSGRHRASWDASAHPAGMYLVRFSAGSVTSTRRLLVVR